MTDERARLSPLVSHARVVDATYKGSARHLLAEERYVVKFPRREGETELVEEWFNELFAHDVGVQLGIPVPETHLLLMPNGKLGLASSLHSTFDLATTPPSLWAKVSNIQSLPSLFVFDQFVFNGDRRLDHVVLTGNPGSDENVQWYAIDHGHALFSPSGGGVTLDRIEEFANRLVEIRMNYQVRTFADLLPAIRAMDHLDESKLDTLVNHAADTLVAMGLNVNQRTRVEFRREVTRPLVKARRIVLPSLLEKWCEQKGLPRS